MRRLSWVLGCAWMGACGGATATRQAAPEVASPVSAEDGSAAGEPVPTMAPAPDVPPAEAAPAAARLDAAKQAMGDAEGDATVGVAGLGARGAGLGGGGIGEGIGLGGGGIDGVGYGAGRGMMERKAEYAKASRIREDLIAQSPLRAGATDDNADPGAFLRFLESWSKDPSVSVVMRPMATGRSELLTVRAADGRPLPGATVELLAEDGRVVARVGTYGDGRAPYYPDLWPDARSARVAGTGDVVRLGGEAPVIDTGVAGPADRVRLDVAFILDTTGSMDDELDRIQGTLAGVLRQVDQLGQDVDLRLGGVLYRDEGDAYVTKPIALTADRDGFAATLMAATADGGGDTPEALGPALSDTVHRLAWRDGAAHVAFLIADAEPHVDQGARRYDQGALGAVGRGIRVHTVAASGLSPAGTVVMRQVAQATRGEFIYIEYGSTAATAASHGVASPEQVASNNLDAILFERIQREIRAWRRG